MTAKREVLLLELRNIIADKEWATACASMETADRDGWTRDWYEDIRRQEPRLRELFAILMEPEP